MKPHILFPTVCLAALLAAGCAPYKMEIQQGGQISDEAVSQIKPGLTKREVRYLLGTPLVVDPFRDNRWDYYYYRKQGRFSREEKQLLTLIFEGDKVARVEGDLKSTPEPDVYKQTAIRNKRLPGEGQTGPVHKEPGITDPGLSP